MTRDAGWHVMVPSSTSVLLHRHFDRPGRVFGVAGFAGLLQATPGQIRINRGSDTVAVISDIDHVGSELADNGTGVWVPAVTITTLGAKLAFMPYERPGLLPHMVKDPSAISDEIQAIVFGTSG